MLTFHPPYSSIHDRIHTVHDRIHLLYQTKQWFLNYCSVHSIQKHENVESHMDLGPLLVPSQTETMSFHIHTSLYVGVKYMVMWSDLFSCFQVILNCSSFLHTLP